MNRTLRRILRLPLVDRAIALASRALDVVCAPIDHLLGLPALLEGRLVDEPPAATDALVVFGCGYVTAHVHIDERLDAAVRMWKASPATAIVATGADWSESYQETRYMRDHLVRAGVPAELVTRDGRGTTTVDSVLNLRKTMRGARVVMVTSEYHVRRCVLLGRRAGLDAYGMRAPEGIRPGRGFNWLRDRIALYPNLLRLGRELRREQSRS